MIFRRRPQVSYDDAKKFLDGKPCQHCQGFHVRACNRVRRMVFQSGEVKEVEFWRRWSDRHTIWPEDIERAIINGEKLSNANNATD